MPDLIDPPGTPQLYLITPPAFDIEAFPGRLARVLDGVEVACLRLSVASQDADSVARAADALREIAHARDVALVVERHTAMVERLGLDGVHLMDGARSVRKARTDLGADAIIGTLCGATRHEGLGAGEAGADYVAFAPVGVSALGGDTPVDPDLFAWWSEMVEVPVVAEGALTADLVAALAPVTDFFAVGEEIWGTEDPLAALRALMAPLA